MTTLTTDYHLPWNLLPHYTLRNVRVVS